VRLHAICFSAVRFEGLMSFGRSLSASTFVSACLPRGLCIINARLQSASYLKHVKYLASDELQGRGNGTPGLERAADYIAGQFKASGLQPAGDAGVSRRASSSRSDTNWARTTD